ncbi:hypothetical protein BJX66DRAFT_61898 [Aspergillus keveii]|uniref:Uncharacterized protein n=1 Tax=Aspergillus keveii TaxID=714993 RepID=A0ABR4GG50_9EURO
MVRDNRSPLVLAVYAVVLATMLEADERMSGHHASRPVLGHTLDVELGPSPLIYRGSAQR